MPIVIGKRDVSDQEYRYIYEHVEVWRIDQDTGEIVLVEVGEECNWGDEHGGMVNTNYDACFSAGPEDKEPDSVATSPFVSFGSYHKQRPQEVDCGNVYFLNTKTIMSGEVPGFDPYDADSSVASFDEDPPVKRPTMFGALGKLSVAPSTSSFISYREDTPQEEYPKPRFPICTVLKSKGLPSVKFHGDGSCGVDREPSISSLMPIPTTTTGGVATSSFISYCDREPSQQKADSGKMCFLNCKVEEPEDELNTCQHKPTPAPRAKPASVALSLAPSPGLPVSSPAPSFVSYCDPPRPEMNRGHAFFPPQDPKVPEERPTFKLRLYFTGMKLSARA